MNVTARVVRLERGRGSSPLQALSDEELGRRIAVAISALVAHGHEPPADLNQETLENWMAST